MFNDHTNLHTNDSSNSAVGLTKHNSSAMFVQLSIDRRFKVIRREESLNRLMCKKTRISQKVINLG